MLQRGLALLPRDLELHVRLAESLRFAERHEQAIDVLEHATAIAPDDILLLLELASALRMRGDKVLAGR